MWKSEHVGEQRNSPALSRCARESCGDSYLEVVVNCSGGRLYGCEVTCRGLQAGGSGSVLRAGAAELRGEAGHPLQADGSLCAAQGRDTTGRGPRRGRWLTESATRPPIPDCPVSVATCGLVPGCLSPRTTLRSSVPHVRDGALMVIRRPRVQQGKVRVQAEVPLEGQDPLRPVLQRGQ